MTRIGHLAHAFITDASSARFAFTARAAFRMNPFAPFEISSYRTAISSVPGPPSHRSHSAASSDARIPPERAAETGSTGSGSGSASAMARGGS